MKKVCRFVFRFRHVLDIFQCLVLVTRIQNWGGWLWFRHHV